MQKNIYMTEEVQAQLDALVADFQAHGITQMNDSAMIRWLISQAHAELTAKKESK